MFAISLSPNFKNISNLSFNPSKHAVTSTRLIKQVDEYAEKLLIIFGPLFFAIIGAQVDLHGVNLDVLYLADIVIVIAIVTTIVGCGLPSLIFLKDKTKALRVGIGMISQGKVGLIVAE